MPVPATSFTRWLRGLGLAVTLGVVEVLLVRAIGGPGQLLTTLRGVPAAGADPDVAVLALLGLLAELLAGYLLGSVALRLLASRPGTAGRAASAASRLLTIPAVRHAVDATIAGMLLAQITVGPAVAAHAADGGLADHRPVTAATADAVPSSSGAWRSAVEAIAQTSAAGRATAQPATSPIPPESAHPPPAAAAAAGPPLGFVPLPGWAAGRSAAQPPDAAQPADRGGSYRIRPGDTLWGIASAHLPRPARTQATIAAYWRQIYQANQQRLGPNPDLIRPGVTITIPRYAAP